MWKKVYHYLSNDYWIDFDSILFSFSVQSKFMRNTAEILNQLLFQLWKKTNEWLLNGSVNCDSYSNSKKKKKEKKFERAVDRLAEEIVKPSSLSDDDLTAQQSGQ